MKTIACIVLLTWCSNTYGLCGEPWMDRFEGQQVSFQVLVSNGFYAVKSAHDRFSSGLQVSPGILINWGPNRHFRMHMALYNTWDRFYITENSPKTLTGQKYMQMNIGDFALGAGYAIHPRRYRRRFGVEFSAGLMSTYVYKNKRYFSTRSVQRNLFTGGIDTAEGVSTYISAGIMYRLNDRWHLRLNFLHRHIPFRIVEAYRPPPLFVQLGICFGTDIRIRKD